MTDRTPDHPRQPTGNYARLEARVLGLLPAFMTPLRLRIALGYFVVLLLALYGWEQISAAWRYLVTLLMPIAAVIGALLALKLSVVFVSLFTLASALLKILFGFLMAVLKPGILKAIFVPQLMALVAWVHKKSARLQHTVRRIYEWLKSRAEIMVEWWQRQNFVDKALLSGFLIPLLLIVFIIFIIKRAVAIFAIKKITEQVVQKSTKFVIKNFYRLPLVGGVPAAVAQRTRKLTRKEDRVDVVEDLKNLGGEIYPMEALSRHQHQQDEGNQPARQTSPGK